MNAGSTRVAPFVQGSHSMSRTRDLRLTLPALCLAALMLALALPAPATAQADATAAAAPAAEVEKIPNSKCLKCHDDPELKTDDGKSLAVIEAEFKTGAHKRLDCVDCHVDALTIKHPRNDLGPVTFDVCTDCHEEEITPFQSSVHARVKGGKPVSCQGCHGNIHTTPRSNDPNAPMSDVNQVRNGVACHEERMEGYRSSVHARSLIVAAPTESYPR